MQDIFTGLWNFLILMDPIPLEDKNHTIIFSLGCYIVGFLVVIVDAILYKINDRSFLKLKYTSKTFFINLFLWPLAAFIVGYLGQMLKIFQLTVQACAGVGFTWPILTTKLLNKIAQQEPEQKQTKEQ